MRELGFDGLTEDHRFLLVSDPSNGEQYRVPVDFDVLQVVDVPAPPTRSEQRMETVLSPRDIQTRIRRGESVQELADASGMAVERIEPFAGPVLAERAYMCEQARKTSVRRKHVTGSGVRLGGFVADEAAWDSFRREDGRWTVLVTPPAGDSTATFTFDVQARYVMPVDAFAHELVDDVPQADTTGNMAIADALRSPVDEQLAIAEVDEAVVDDRTQAVDVAREAFQAEDADDLPPDIAAAERLLEDARRVSSVSSLKEARDRRAQTALEREEAEALAEQTDEPHQHDALESDLHDDDAAASDEAPQKKRRERRHVPSWDEIMFGGAGD